MAAWNGWYHVNGNTYGTWLPGDSRGWRERGHKKHVAGDYKNPPPAGSGDALHGHARKLLKQPPVHLTCEQRAIAGRAIVELLAVQELESRGFVGRLWGNGSNVVPIKDRQHQLNVFGYIARHKDKNAWVWTFREGLYWREDGDNGQHA